MKNLSKLSLNFIALITLIACGGGGGGQSFSITANSQSFSLDEDATYVGALTASASTPSTITYQKVSGPS